MGVKEERRIERERRNTTESRRKGGGRKRGTEWGKEIEGRGADRDEPRNDRGGTDGQALEQDRLKGG